MTVPQRLCTGGILEVVVVAVVVVNEILGLVGDDDDDESRRSRSPSMAAVCTWIRYCAGDGLGVG